MRASSTFKTAYRESLPREARIRAIAEVVALDIPCIVATRNADVPSDLVEATDAAGIPLIQSALGAHGVGRATEKALGDCS